MRAALGPTLHLLVAAAFVLVALYQWRRRTQHAHRSALRFFVVWWLGLATVELGSAIQGYLIVAGNTSVAWHGGIEYASALAFSIGLWGLLTYAFYLWGAPDRIWIGTGAYYGLYGGLALATMAWLDPVTVEPGNFGVHIGFARELHPTWLNVIVSLFLIPPLVGALSILHVARLEVEPKIRRRAMIVGIGLVLWCLSTWSSLALGTRGDTAWALLPLAMDALAGVLVVWAYHFIGFRRPVVFERVDTQRLSFAAAIAASATKGPVQPGPRPAPTDRDPPNSGSRDNE